MHEDPVLNRLRALKPRFSEWGLTRVRVFGSRARGTDARADSDLDILVEFEKMPSLFGLANIQAEMEDATGVRVDLVFPHKVFPELLPRILAEARDV